jgi:glycosyltransferase involved in cell wall biosynthesis
MLDVAELQVEAGHDVAFYGMDHPENDPQPYAHRFPSYVEFEPTPPAARDRVRLLGRMMWSTTAARGMGRLLDEFRPDVVHLHNIYHQLSPSILRPIAARQIRAVVTLHDYKLACPTYRMLDRGQICEACVGGHFQQAPLRRCKDDSLLASAAAAAELWIHTLLGAYAPIQVFICPSQFMNSIMQRAGVFPERLQWVPHFVAPGETQERVRPSVVFAGRLSPEKGVDILVRAMARLGPDTHLDIAGTGPELGRLERLADEHAPDQVTFHGRLDRSATLALIGGATAVAVPSRWYENQPMTVLEAFAAGRPVVASALGGIPELIDDTVDGRLVPHDDVAAMADALDPLLRDPDRADAMGRAGLAKVRRDFAPARHLARLTAIYQDDSGC